ncbi:S-layer homology domain-containing protein [Paenibacillus sp. KQZ6P-2]|uniref:S-layer homology domain-containing protein n=1 Tax=Paenibacillus mangrovi TaxID=2931978 RepID=A0A9X1WPN3_9BACL|nr:S-layer homology domain-containing protein [Paenibacillus mangrovi]MCJ8012774.1 S-layer homology domain-containing protein [Paenibacillus mangrovi]
MQRIKKTSVWIMLVAMIVSLFPVGLTKQAFADGGTVATYFIPDDLALRQTALLTTDSTGTQIDRQNIFTSNSATLSFTGVYSHVSDSTLKVKVEQLSSVPDNTGIKWVTDSTHFKEGSIAVDTSSTTAQKFKVTSLPLFAGFNKITLYGSQNGISRSDVFFVLYDQVPYISDLKMTGSSMGEVPLSEGVEAVSDKEMVAVQGQVNNATAVTVSVNDGTAFDTTLLQNGKFFSSALKLKKGMNILTINVKNGSDVMSVTRTVYYYTKTDPFVTINMNHNGKDYQLLDNVPVVTNNGKTATSERLTVTVMIPDKIGAPFIDAGTVKVGKLGNMQPIDLKSTSVSVKDVPITSSDAGGNKPAYRLVTLTFDGPDVDPTAIGVVQNFVVEITYGTDVSMSRDLNFQYAGDVTGIDDIKYLKGYDPVQNADLTKISQLPLTEVDTSTFYILVKADRDITNQTLHAEYSPSGDKLQVDFEKIGTKDNEVVYKVSNISSGRQNVRFYFDNSKAYFNAVISYAIKNNIYIENVRNGQTFEIDSNDVSKTIIPIKGEYRNFDNLEQPEFFVNGISNKNLGIDFILDAQKKFSIDLKISNSGPLYYGENKIKFVGYSKDGRGNTTTITNELRIYISDTNIANITVFQPSLADDAKRLPINDLDLKTLDDNKVLAQMTARYPDFVYNNDKYETTQLKYDLVIQGSGAEIINLNQGTKKLFSSQDNQTIKDYLKDKQANTVYASGDTTFNGANYKYDIAIYNGRFLLRIKDIPFETLGSQIYNIELINKTGARASQRIEITRVAEPFRILSPKTTVGDRIVVNKNFVRFDIEAEGADKVIIDKQEAHKRPDLSNRFYLDYVGLKPDKTNKIKIQVVRGKDVINQTIEIYYTGTVGVNTQFMTDKPSTKYSVFNKAMELSFPKGTVLKSANVGAGEVTKYYPDNKLLFGIADPKDGVVERRNDYGNLINIDRDDRTPKGETTIPLATDLTEPFTSIIDQYNFTRVSNIYWVSGGLGEHGTTSSSDYMSPTNGLPPHSYEYQNTKYNFKESAELQPDRKLVPTQRGTLKLSYDKNVVDEAGTTITVFRFTDKAKWENIGGVVDAKNHTISVPFDEFGYYVVMKQSRGFDDITRHPWARNILNALYAKGIMVNVQPNAFGADDLTTRGEFATLLVKGLNLPLNYDKNVQTFFDVVPDAKTDTWDFEHIETAARAGIITGMSEGNFGVLEPITREDAALMVSRAMKLKLPANDAKLKSSLDKQFLDSGQISYYARPAVDAIVRAKIMVGQPVTLPGAKKPSYNFNPKSSMTRAEAGKIAVELFKKTSQIFPKNLS